jgi:hypothetical protein
MADAHFAIRRNNDYIRGKARSMQLPFRNHEAGEDGGRPLTLSDCVFYRPSTRTDGGDICLTGNWAHGMFLYARCRTGIDRYRPFLVAQCP